MELTKENCTVRNATLLVNGEIIAGSIFGDTFVAGTWLGWKSPNPMFDTATSKKITLNVAGRECDMVDDGFMVQHVYRVQKSEL
jgi:hypothetical protein